MEEETKVRIDDPAYSPYSTITVPGMKPGFPNNGSFIPGTNIRVLNTMLSKDETDTNEVKVIKDAYWKDVWHSTGQELGVSGLKYATSKTEPIARRVLWAFLIICGLSFMTYQVVESFQEYYRRSSSTAVDDIFPAKLRFPTLTICNENKIVRSKARALGVEGVIEDLNPPWYGMGHYPSLNITAARLELREAYQKYNFTSQKDFIRSISYSFKEMIFGCFFASKECNSSMFTEVWTDMGLCFQFNPGSQNIMADRAGSNYGLWLLGWAQQNDYIDTTDYAAGFRLKAEMPGGFVSMALDSVRVSPGHVTSIQLQQTNTLLLEPPYGNCSDHRKLKRFSDYSSFHCETECIIDYIVDRCGCTPLSYPISPGENTCTITDETVCVTPAYYAYIAEERGQSCVCEPECTYTTYNMIYSSNVISKHFANYIYRNVTYGSFTPTDVRDDFAAINIYYPRLSFKRVESQVAYTTTMLFNDLGGALGLMLGSTFFTIYEVLDIFLWAGIYRLRSRESTKVTHENN